MIAAVATAVRTKIITSETKAAETATTSRFCWYHCEARRERPCGRAETGAPASQRSRSEASAPAVGYRCLGYFSKNLMQIASRSRSTARFSSRSESG